MSSNDKRLKLLAFNPGDFVRAGDLEALVGPLCGTSELNFEIEVEEGQAVRLGFQRRRTPDGDVWETVR